VFRLPRSALRNQNQVLVVDTENRLRYRNVDIIRLEKDSFLVSAGLSSGERVNISPIQTVVDGMRVSVSLESLESFESPESFDLKG